MVGAARCTGGHKFAVQIFLLRKNYLSGKKILYVHITNIPPHLQYVASVYLVKVENPKNVTDFDSILNKLLTCSWGHFEHLI